MNKYILNYLRLNKKNNIY